MNVWHDIDSNRITPEKFLALIEISKGSKNKYELDKETGLLILDRILYTSTHYPANYGFIPKTYAQDNDPLDVLVLCSESILPLTLVECYPIGVVVMTDEGYRDEKIIAVPTQDPNYNKIREYKEIQRHIIDEIMHFFTVYKELEGKETAVNMINDAKEAKKIIRASIEEYEERFGEN
ncbi:inorganic diphosphatase [Anaerosphaera multitolerans]|uniref:Inorganic pyrophosphatase n=1 Tax=Anaerosphaera multitolerans TaxID=2487351 RepID=A0A437S648_9FIRM|nr:inorganic diphosphatase [Anaerosphaera multitolerans]RVU54522.1 inorganic diphosphatase [Anaerosphaera multitolerans]